MTQSLLYTSHIQSNDDHSVVPIWLEDLVDQAIINNKAHNISGVMGFKDGKIIQLLEGDVVDIQRLFSNIKQDTRHTNISTLLNIQNSTRIFHNWSMLLEPNIETSYLFKNFLMIHFDNLVRMNDKESDELIFFADHIFQEVIQSKDKTLRQ